MINAKTTDIPIPTTRTEHFMYSAITGSESGMKADTQAEMYLEAIKDGDTNGLETLETRTILDMYLEARQTGNLDDLPKPRTTSEMLLYQAITGEDLGAKPVSNMDKYLSLLEPNNYDARLEIESESPIIKLTNSKDGVVEIKKIEGKTLTNLIRGFSKGETFSSKNYEMLYSKPNTTYTILLDIEVTSTIFVGFLKRDNNWSAGYAMETISTPGTYIMRLTPIEGDLRFRIDGGGSRVVVNNLMVLEGNYTNKELPIEHFEGMKSVGEHEGNKIEIEVTCKNLFDIKDGWRVGKTIDHITGAEISYPSEMCTDFIDIKPNTQYYLKTYNYVTSHRSPITVYFYDINKRVVRASSSGNGLAFNGRYEGSFTSPQNAEYMRVRLVTNDTSVLTQLEEGNVATSYVPHAKNTKEITLQEPLRALPNGVKDRVMKVGGRYYVERNCGITILDGSISNKHNYYGVVTNETNSNCHKLIINNCKYFNVSKYGIVDKLPFYNKSHSREETYVFPYSGDNHMYIVTRKSLGLDTVNKFLQWLSENPITLIYQLETPIYEEITPELQKLILTCYDNATLHFKTNITPKSLISYTANTSNIYKHLNTLKLSKAECDSIINSMKRV